MSYVALGFGAAPYALGAEKDQSEAYKKLAEECTKGLKDQDWDTKAGREAGVKRAAQCAGKGVCLYFSEGAAPPEVLDLCGTIAGKIVGPVIDVWNDIFGNADEWKAEYARRARSATTRRLHRQVEELLHEMAASFYKAASDIIELNDRLIPEERGKLGGGPGRSSNTVTFADGRVLTYNTWPAPQMEPAKQLIVRLGNAQNLTVTVPFAIFGPTGAVIGHGQMLDRPLAPESAYTSATALNAWFTSYVAPFMDALKRGEALAAAHVTARAAAWQTARTAAKVGTKEFTEAATRSARTTMLLNLTLFALGAGTLWLAWRRR